MQFWMSSAGSRRCGIRFGSHLAILAILLSFVLSTETAEASTVSNYRVELSWQASRTATVVGYRILIGTEPSVYTTSIDVGTKLGQLVSNLPDGRDLFFVVVAYDDNEVLSVPSNELQIRIPPTTTSPLDCDQDGLSDEQEDLLGTNPQMVDTDGDRVEDGQETVDGTDPLDPGSALKPLSTEVCAEWNGFLGGMYNILEHLNLTSKTLRVRTLLYDLDGNVASQTRFTLTPNNQHDLLVHDLPGWSLNRIGKVCSSHDGVPGDIDGRMVYYKMDSTRASNKDFQFAFAMPFLNSITGAQYVPFNTYQPSFDSADAGNLVANWIQITNQTSESQKGTLEFYGPDGKLIGEESLVLRGGARADAAGHQFGPNLVGLVKWNPENSNAGFTLRNVRYLYDNPVLADSFNTAFQLGGTKGSGQTASVPVSTIGRTAVLELSNTTSSAISVDVRVTKSDGSEKGHFRVKLAAHATQHLILDQTLPESTGVATVRASMRGALVATAMHYVRTATGKILYMYGIQTEEALGTKKNGSYNTYLGQTSTLLVANTSNLPQNISLALTRVGGTKMALAKDLSHYTVPANGLIELNLNRFEDANEYGVVELDMENKGVLTAWVLREKPGNYVMTTLVR